MIKPSNVLLTAGVFWALQSGKLVLVSNTLINALILALPFIVIFKIVDAILPM